MDSWIVSIGLDPAAYGTHTMRRTKATLIYRRTKNIRAVQLLLGHTKLESTIRYLGIEVDDALDISETTDAWYMVIESVQIKDSYSNSTKLKKNFSNIA